ncbi:hypothetical protein NPIL_702481 [Nephila pilipes]|uniref:Uncharacterized protein n=1 Tax=Nephila pilipes TaxID=299642 RepID=A0A8X6THG6_NEPPI|nr:hypothetical protein NPIL_702481 [Nephila pilipes]
MKPYTTFCSYSYFGRKIFPRRSTYRSGNERVAQLQHPPEAREFAYTVFGIGKFKGQKLLLELQLGDNKPYTLLRKIKELAGTALNDSFLGFLWLQRLPAEIQIIISISSEKLENLAKLANKIAEERASSFTSNVCAFAGHSEQSSDSPNSPLNEMIAIRGEIAALSKQVERISRPIKEFLSKEVW